MRIGLRTIKTGLSVFICILISILLQRDTYVVMALTAIFTLREDMVNTLKFGKHRVVGNTFGALFSIIAIFLFHLVGDGKSVQLLVMPLLIIGMISLLSHFGYQEGTVGACATLLTILFMVPETESYQYAFARVVDSFIGMVVAIGVNQLLPNKKMMQALEKQLENEEV
ncbi:FUSC family protein [Enterococcus saccharolyticus]|uniref:FUSC family protein n=1 Tax=Candidatus Enterococcus willemsii TaxID=1857215 RepID=A0ABQ6Z014_9ENTE|nr:MULTISPECIES: aromatic acid exporter family protein [Enterococcus]KAF1304043.1 hypothetical protein BAU17_03905 [Enterococcus sp. CU12B]MCD5002096.1 FUSC family protein [Enterococcus saccharolyticus]